MKISLSYIRTSSAAFSLLELLAIIGVISLLLLFGVMVAVIQGHRKWQRVACVNTLKNVGLAIRMYTTENTTNGAPPFQPGSNSLKTFEDFVMSLRRMSNELSTPFILGCTADSRRPTRDWEHLTRTNISYFFDLTSGTESNPNAILVGDRNIVANGVRLGPGIVKLGSNATDLGWDRNIHRYQGNVLMGDGSVQQLSSARLREHWTNQGVSSVMLAVP